MYINTAGETNPVFRILLGPINHCQDELDPSSSLYPIFISLALCLMSLRTIELFWLEDTFKIIKSKH